MDSEGSGFLIKSPKELLRRLGCLAATLLAALGLIYLTEPGRRYPPAGIAPVGALRTITTAQAIFRESDRDGDKVFDFGDLTELGRANLVDTVLSAGTKQGYRFVVIPGTDGRANKEFVWWAAAAPIKPGLTGDRYFFTNQSGVIYASREGPIRPRTGSLTNEPARGTQIGGR